MDARPELQDRPDIIAKAAWRILPILMICYFAAFLDRVNIGFAALTMNKDLGFSASAFGFGAGIFFLGYVLCELPSNLMQGYRMLSHQLRPALAGGETFGAAAAFQPFLEAGCLDVLQPDIAICGGLTGLGRVVALAELYDRPVVPHVWGSTVNFHAALHFAATLPAQRSGTAAPFPFLEFDAGPNPLMDLVGRPAVNGDGTVSVPDGPGLGIDLHAGLLEPFIVSRREVAA
jgi:hypothetical protein